MDQFFVLTFLCLMLVQANAQDNGVDCDPVPVCDDFEQKRITVEDEQPIIANWENESDIARSRSWEGVAPVNYKINLNFSNRTHYSGSVAIAFKLLTSPFKRIMINHGSLNPSVQYEGITVRKLCDKEPANDHPKGAPAPSTRCIEKATFLEANETLILDFREVSFKKGLGYRYEISFPFFEGHSEGDGEGGAKGLVRAGSEPGDDLSYSASTTIFQMRYARTVFPCFDHPALKARFKLCIERPDQIQVASNTVPIVRESATLEDGRKRDCFQQTLRIPTYVFTFALMENYTSEFVLSPNGGPLIEIFAPAGTNRHFRWMFDETIAAVQYLEKITHLKFLPGRLAFVVAYPAPFWGVENWGLVTVDGGFMQSPESTETAYTILYHEIVHQWLGDVVTISEWREICLQEGLTTYFEWKISADRRNGSLDRKAHAAMRKADDKESHYEPVALMEYKKTQDIVERCYGRPAFFFHAVAERYGFEAMEQFLAALVKQKPFGTADIRMWDRVMNEVTAPRSSDMKGYIKGWFQEPGPVYLLVSKVPDSDCIIIRQKYYGRKKKDSSPVTVPRIAPLDIEIYDTELPKKVIPIVSRALETTVCDINKPTYLVDPASSTMTRKAYTLDTYRSILKHQKEHPDTLTHRQLDTFVDQFCKALVGDVIPLTDEPSSTTGENWLQLYETVKNSTILSKSSICWCCMNSKEENKKIRMCLRSWNGFCSHLRLSEIVGYNYNFTREEIWG